ncbi:BTAD domain-containing putative transcriptional regulator, partial [Streptomyces sp. NPDC058291]|uniref:BTAD domain-containing putative transcriptional regulator n=1 Tax=Streptomyces sp. NPDC058291 TaxID=3346427 RepID=UPI0036E9226F
MGGVMRRYGLRFGLLGPPVLYTADTTEATAEPAFDAQSPPDPQSAPDPQSPSDPQSASDPQSPPDPQSASDPQSPPDPQSASDPQSPPDPEAVSAPDPESDPEAVSPPGSAPGSEAEVRGRRDAGTADEAVPRVRARPPYETVRGPKVRALLVALLLEAGRTVPVDSLKEALWGGAPPASAQASLHNHVTRLRRLLDDPERLRAVASGYRLRVEQGELDVHVFEQHVAAARGAQAAQNWERVVRECAAALALWRGAPLSGLPAELGGYAFARRLREARLLLLEWRHDAELALGTGRFEHRLPELTALAAEHPLREAFHRQLMLALHRTGRQAEALAVHRDLRTRLVEDLGVEPGPAVREAHVEVLLGSMTDALAAPPSPAPATSSPAPATSSPAPATSSPAPAPLPAPTAECDSAARSARHPRPAQLPPPPAHFTGRLEDLRRLHRTLASGPVVGDCPGGDPGPAVVVLSGTAGVGKSALALQVAHGLRERFPDGQLYLRLHGATPGMTPLAAGQALTALLRDLGVEPRHIPEHPDAAAALLRTLLAPTRTLVVLDDAATAAQVRPLLPAGAGCAVIVTSRSPLTALDGAHRFPLAPLSGEDSAALLRTASGPGEGRAELSAGHPLVGLTGRLPLALRVVAARLAARSALTPDVLARQLADAASRLAHLEYDDLSVRRSLAVAHEALAGSGRAVDRDAALVLRRIGALDLPTYGVPLLARLIGADEPRAEAALNRLVDVALLEERAYGRYTPHDLVRDFARELAEADAAPHGAADATLPTPLATAPGPTASTAPATSPTPVRAPAPAGAQAVALHWYAAVAERVLAAVAEAGLDQDDRRRPTAAQPPAHTAYLADVPPFAGPEDAFAWADAELENIVALVESSAGETPAATTGASVSASAPGAPGPAVSGTPGPAVSGTPGPAVS